MRLKGIKGGKEVMERDCGIKKVNEWKLIHNKIGLRHSIIVVFLAMSLWVHISLSLPCRLKLSFTREHRYITYFEGENIYAFCFSEESSLLLCKDNQNSKDTPPPKVLKQPAEAVSISRTVLYLWLYFKIFPLKNYLSFLVVFPKLCNAMLLS